MRSLKRSSKIASSVTSLFIHATSKLLSVISPLSLDTSHLRITTPHPTTLVYTLHTTLGQIHFTVLTYQSGLTHFQSNCLAYTFTTHHTTWVDRRESPSALHIVRDPLSSTVVSSVCASLPASHSVRQAQFPWFCHVGQWSLAYGDGGRVRRVGRLQSQFGQPCNGKKSEITLGYNIASCAFLCNVACQPSDCACELNRHLYHWK